MISTFITVILDRYRGGTIEPKVLDCAVFPVPAESRPTLCLAVGDRPVGFRRPPVLPA